MFRPDDSYPRRPDPIDNVPMPPGQTFSGELDDNEELRIARAAADARGWADAEGDDDTWEGFFMSLDLLEKSSVNGQAS